LRSNVLSLISAAPAKNELFHYTSTAQLLKYGKAIHLNKSTMQNGKPRKSCLLSSYSQLDKDVSRLAASVINDDRRCRSGGYRVAHLHSIEQVSLASPASPDVFSITEVSRRLSRRFLDRANIVTMHFPWRPVNYILALLAIRLATSAQFESWCLCSMCLQHWFVTAPVTTTNE